MVSARLGTSGQLGASHSSDDSSGCNRNAVALADLARSALAQAKDLLTRLESIRQDTGQRALGLEERMQRCLKRCYMAVVLLESEASAQGGTQARSALHTLKQDLRDVLAQTGQAWDL